MHKTSEIPGQPEFKKFLNTYFQHLQKIKTEPYAVARPDFDNAVKCVWSNLSMGSSLFKVHVNMDAITESSDIIVSVKSKLLSINQYHIHFNYYLAA